jgi:hypothetical protein
MKAFHVCCLTTHAYPNKRKLRSAKREQVWSRGCLSGSALRLCTWLRPGNEYYTVEEVVFFSKYANTPIDKLSSTYKREAMSRKIPSIHMRDYEELRDYLLHDRDSDKV